MAHFVSPLLVLVLLLGSGSARAQEADATHAAAARALFTEGVTAADAGDWATAAERFRRARALRGSPTIALNLAVALTHLGQLVEATELLRSVLRDPGSTDALRGSANATLAELEPRFAWVELEVEGDVDGITFDADGRHLSAELIGTAVPFDPGHHRISASRGTEVVASAELDLTEGQRIPVALVIPPPPVEPVVEPVDEPEPEPEPEPVVPTGGGPDPVAVGLGVTGGILVAGGVVALVLVLVLPGEPSPFVGNAGVLEIGR